MRNLTVHRIKKFVASLVKIRICIKTESEGDINFSDTHLKVIGELKNGTSLKTEIPDNTKEVYVVYDKMFPQKFHSKIDLVDGEENIVLYAIPRFGPYSGNPFALSYNKSLSNVDLRRVKNEESKKEKSLAYKIFYWVMIIAAAIVGFYLGSSLFS